jgi:hypothetical protein
MTHSDRTNDWNPDVSRVSEELTNRLRTRGIDVSDTDTPDDISQIADAVEEFETAVEEHGGDLMVDEPPLGTAGAQPDDRQFLLPTRAADESVSRFLQRLRDATAAIRERRSE